MCIFSFATVNRRTSVCFSMVKSQSPGCGARGVLMIHHSMIRHGSTPPLNKIRVSQNQRIREIRDLGRKNKIRTEIREPGGICEKAGGASPRLAEALKTTHVTTSLAKHRSGGLVVLHALTYCAICVNRLSPTGCRLQSNIFFHPLPREWPPLVDLRSGDSAGASVELPSLL